MFFYRLDSNIPQTVARVERPSRPAPRDPQRAPFLGGKPGASPKLTRQLRSCEKDNNATQVERR